MVGTVTAGALQGSGRAAEYEGLTLSLKPHELHRRKPPADFEGRFAGAQILPVSHELSITPLMI